MSGDACDASSLELRPCGRGGRNAVDRVYDDARFGQVESQRGITEQRVLQLVDGAVLSGGDHLVLGLTLRLAEGQRFPVFPAEHGREEGPVDELVVGGEHRTRGTEEGDSSTVGIHDGRRADVVLYVVKGHDVARGGDPQWQVGVGEILEVGELEHALVCDEPRTAVSGIVHDERAVLLLAFDDGGNLGIGMSRGGGLFGIGVPHHLFQNEFGVQRLDIVGVLVLVVHVQVVVAVVAHEHQFVLPGPSVAVLGIGDGLVDHGLCLFHACHGEASHGDVVHVLGHRIAALAVVESCEEAVVDIAEHRVERVLALVAEQIVVGVESAAVAGEHAVVPHATSEEQQIARQVGIGGRAVIEHLQVAAVGIGVGCAAAELVVELISLDNAHAQAVVLLVETCEALCLLQIFTGGGDDDHHVRGCVGMMVLVGDGAYQRRCGEGGGEVGLRCGIAPRHRHVVQSERSAIHAHDFHGVVGVQRVDGIGGVALPTFVIVVVFSTAEIDAHRAEYRVVEHDLCRAGLSGGDGHGELSGLGL